MNPRGFQKWETGQFGSWLGVILFLVLLFWYVPESAVDYLPYLRTTVRTGISDEADEERF